MANRPRMLMCYLCGREYGSSSLTIHIPQCQKKWQATEDQKPPRERRNLPLPPSDVDMSVGSTKNSAQVQEFNNAMYKTFDEQTLTRCPYCERTFSDTAYKHHQRACTADSPAKPAGTGLGKGSLAHKLANLDGRVGGGIAGLSMSATEFSAEKNRSNMSRTSSGSSPRNPLSKSITSAPSPPSPRPATLSSSAAAARPATSSSASPATPNRLLSTPAKGGHAGALSLSMEELVRLAKAAGAWEVKQELVINNPGFAVQEIMQCGSRIEQELIETTRKLQMRPAEVFDALASKEYLKWKIN